VIDHSGLQASRAKAAPGGLAAAKQLLDASAVSDDFTTLWGQHRFDLSVEARVLRGGFASLFTDEERRVATRRLTDYGYTLD
jgi:hypothetical protein